MAIKPFIVIFICVLISTDIFSQRLYFQSYSTSQGLTQNSIYSIAETSEGFMWFGTQDGLNRFDGKNFVKIDVVFEGADSLRKPEMQVSKMITALYAAKDNFLWVGTTKEVLLYNRFTNKCTLPKYQYKNFQIPNNVWIVSITEDDNENIWVVTQTEGLFCYNKRQKEMVKIRWKGAVPEKIVSVCIDAKKNICISGENDVYLYNNDVFQPLDLDKKIATGKGASITELKPVNNQLWLILNSSEIIILDHYADKLIYHSFQEEFSGKKYLSEPRIIHQSNSNTVWIGSRSEGLLKVNITTGTFENSGTSFIDHSLKSEFVLSFYTNRQNITWIGLSGGGIAKFDIQKIQFSLWRSEPTITGRNQDNMLLSIFSENDEDFYMGTLYDGLMHRNIKTGFIKYYHPPLNNITKTGSRNIYSIIAGEKQLLWMATWGGLYSFDRATKKFEQYVDYNDEQTRELCVLIQLKGTNKLLVGGYRGGLRMFDLITKKWELCTDTDNYMSNHKMRVRYMKEIENGDVYMSTEAQGLVKYNYHSGKFQSYPQVQAVSGTSRYFSFDSPYVWIATDDGLIQALASNMQIVKVWGTQNVLPNNYIYAVLPDKNNRIWMSCNAGLALLDYKTGICKKFTEDDGLQSLEFNTASCYRDKRGRFWFGGINGLNMIDPDQSLNNKYSIGTLITGITVMNTAYKSDTAIPYIHSITLPYSKNFIGFEFQSPNYSQSENIVYEYMLQGVDTGWVNNGVRNYVNYTQLNPGKYFFKVKSSNNNGLMSDKYATLELVITAPWFKTWWFYILLGLSVTFFIYALINYRISQVRKMERMRQHISADLHDDIGASLTSINILSQLSQQQKIDNATRNEYLQKINEQTSEVTNALRDIVWSINPVNDKLEIILARMKRYAAELLESKNIEYSFESNIKTTDEITNTDIRQNLYLIFKEAVNNLAKYSGATKTIITLYKNNSHIKLEVKDNGHGFNPGQVTKGNGIENMQRRAKVMNAAFSIDSAPQNGTAIKVKIPL